MITCSIIANRSIHSIKCYSIMLARTFLVVDRVRGGPGVNNIIVIIVVV